MYIYNLGGYIQMNYEYPGNTQHYYSSVFDSEKRVNSLKQSFLNHLEAINDLCFNPNIEITQFSIDFMKENNRCTYYVFPYSNYDHNISISAYSSNNKYTDSPNEGQYLCDIEFDKDVCFVKSHWFQDRIFDVQTDLVTKHSEFSEGKDPIFFMKQKDPYSIEVSKALKLGHMEVSLEEYLKTKLEQKIRAVKREMVSISVDEVESIKALEQKLSVMLRHLEEVKQLNYYKEMERVSVLKSDMRYEEEYYHNGENISLEESGKMKATFIERLNAPKDEKTGIPVVTGKKTGIDSLISNAKQRTNSNVMNSRPKNIEKSSSFSRDYI